MNPETEQIFFDPPENENTLGRFDAHNPDKNSYKRFFSWDHVGEDLMRINEPKNEELVPNWTELVSTSFNDVLSYVGANVPRERMEWLFPNMSLNNIANARIKPYLLDRDTFNLFAFAFGGDVLATPIDGADSYEPDKLPLEDKISSPHTGKAVTGYKGPVRERFPVDEGILTTELIQVRGESYILMSQVDSAEATHGYVYELRHELLHLLGAGEMLPKLLEEPFVEYLTNKSSEEDPWDFRGYTPASMFFAITFESMLTDGVLTEAEIKSLIMSRDSGVSAKFRSNFLQMYGDSTYKKVFEPTENLKLIVFADILQEHWTPESFREVLTQSSPNKPLPEYPDHEGFDVFLPKPKFIKSKN